MDLQSLKFLYWCFHKCFFWEENKTFALAQWDGYLYAAPTTAPPARAGAQQHTQQSSEDFYVVAMF
jgi:hypothetical protein